jgi:hypothetical protein
MWEKAIRTYEEFLKNQKASPDDADFFKSQIARLRSNRPAAGNQTSRSKTGTLLDSLGRCAERDNRSVGHWCETAAAAARTEGPFRAVGSYEKDFRDVLAFDQYSLSSFLSQSAQSKSLESYVVSGQQELEDSASAKSAA